MRNLGAFGTAFGLRAGLFGLALALLAGGWLALAPAPASADGRLGTHGYFALWARSGAGSTIYCSGGALPATPPIVGQWQSGADANSVDLHVSGFGETCPTTKAWTALSRANTQSQWTSWRIQLNSTAGIGGTALPGATIGTLPSSFSRRNTTDGGANPRTGTYTDPVHGSLDGTDGNWADNNNMAVPVTITFTIPSSHTGDVYLLFEGNGEDAGSDSRHSHLVLKYTQTAPPPQPQPGGGTPQVPAMPTGPQIRMTTPDRGDGELSVYSGSATTASAHLATLDGESTLSKWEEDQTGENAGQRCCWTTYTAAEGDTPASGTDFAIADGDVLLLGSSHTWGHIAARGRPVEITTSVQAASDAKITLAELNADDALKLTATNGTIVHEQLCPRAEPEHPLDNTPMATSATECTITRAALVAFQGAADEHDVVVGKLAFAYVADAGTAKGGSVKAVWKIGTTDYEGSLAFAHAASRPPAPDGLEVAAFFDWADKGIEYATAGPTAMFTIGRSGTEVERPAMPSGLAWARFDELASDRAVRLSIDRGTLSYIPGTMSSMGCVKGLDEDEPCQITLTRAELMMARDGAVATDLIGNLRVEYTLPVGTTETLTVEAWPDGETEPISATLELGSPGASAAVAAVTLPGDPDRMIAPGQTAEIAAGFRVAVAESGKGWGCAGFGPSFLELTAPHELENGCERMRSTEMMPDPPELTTEWLADDSYLVINGPATFEDGGGKRLSLGGKWNNLRCDLAKDQGAADAGDRDIACYVTNAGDERPKIIVDDDADEDLTITANLVVPDGRTLRLFTGTGEKPPLDNRFAEGVAAFDLPGSIFGSGNVKVGAVKELDRISLTRKPVDGVVPTGTIPEGTTGTKLLLGILNENGVASRLSAVSSITVFTTGGGNLDGDYCTNAVSCSISLKSGDPLAMNAAATNPGPGVVAAIELLFNAPDKPGTANVQATVVGTDGTSFEQTLALVISGPAATLSSGGGVPRVHSMMTADDDRDVIKIPVSASDASGNAAPMPDNATATVRTADGATLPSGSHSAEVECEGTGRLACNVVVTVLASAANPLASGAYTATVSGDGITDTVLRFTVAGPTETIALEIPDQLGGLAESFPATARAEDKDGTAVADGTWVTFNTTATQGGGTPTVIVSSPVPSDHDDDPDTPRVRRAQTKDGAAAASATIIGRGVAVLTATADGKSDSLPVDTRVAASSIEAASPSGDAAAGGLSIYRGASSSTAAAALALGPEGSSVVWLWNGKRWLRYSETEGEAAPGSEDFIVLPGDVLWFSGA